MSPITEIPSKLGIGLTEKALNSFKRSLALPTLLSVLGLCFQPISANAAVKQMNQLNAQQIASLLQQQGVAKEKIPTMTAIALAESGGRTKAFNPTGLDKSYGLFQVNMYGGLGPARMKQFGLQREQDLYDPATNVRAAKQILSSQGLGAWSVYKSGKYKEFLPQAQQATAALGQPQFDQENVPKGGRTFIIFGDQEPRVPTQNFLDDYLLNLASGGAPQIKSAINPVSMLTAAFKTPNYLNNEES